MNQGERDLVLAPSPGREKLVQLKTFQGFETNGFRACLAGPDVLQAVLGQGGGLLAAVLLLHLGHIAQQALGRKLAIDRPGLAGDGRVVEIQRRTVGNHVVEDVAHSIAVFPGREVVKFEGQQIMLPRLPVAVAIRLVQSRIEARVFLAVLPDPRSRLHLDIHRCKGKANLHSAQTDVYHTIGGLQAV